MKINNRKKQLDNLIGQKAAQSFGYSDEQLIAEFDRVAAEPEDPENPEPEVPADTFDKILMRMDEEEKKRKVIRIDQVLKTGILVAAMMTMLFATVVSASGKKGFEYWIWNSDKNQFMWNNTEDLILQDREEEAYQQIKNDLDIKVLRLMYKPVGMKFSQADIQMGYATMQFTYNDNKVYLIQTQQSVETSIGINMDQEQNRKVYNRYLQRDIAINKNMTENGDIEWSAVFTYEKAGYRIEGIMDEREFEKVIGKVAFDN